MVGTREDVNDFRQRVKGKVRKYALSEWEKDHPELYPAQTDPDEEVFCFDALVPVPPAILQEGFDPAGYNWEIANWGCKWGACDPRQTNYRNQANGLGRVAYGFETPWSPPLPFLDKVAALFPALRFDLEFSEGGMAFAGSAAWENGVRSTNKMTEHEMKDWQ